MYWHGGEILRAVAHIQCLIAGEVFTHTTKLQDDCVNPVKPVKPAMSSLVNIFSPSQTLALTLTNLAYFYTELALL